MLDPSPISNTQPFEGNQDDSLGNDETNIAEERYLGLTKNQWIVVSGVSVAVFMIGLGVGLHFKLTSEEVEPSENDDDCLRIIILFSGPNTTTSGKAGWFGFVSNC